MNNTLEKQRFFDQYSGQKIVQGLFTPYEAFTQFTDEHYQSKDNYLLLTSLSDITDEHAIEVLKRSGYSSYNIRTLRKAELLKQEVINLYTTRKLNQESSDYLRSKSYALPFNGKSVEDMIELGYMKLKRK